MKIFKRRMFCEPLTCNRRNKERIKNFSIYREHNIPKNENAVIGLEAYLKKLAWADDLSGKIKVYIVRPYFSNDIIAYFGIRAGMVCSSEDRDIEKERKAKDSGIKLFPQVIPGVEISHFAVNDNYRKKHGNVKRLGHYIFPAFINPIIETTAKIIGTKVVYLYAAGDEKLQSYYAEAFGFAIPEEDEEIIPLVSYYDNGCPFMYYTR